MAKVPGKASLAKSDKMKGKMLDVVKGLLSNYWEECEKFSERLDRSGVDQAEAEKLASEFCKLTGAIKLVQLEEDCLALQNEG